MAPVATRRALASTPGDRYSPLRARSGGRMGSKMSLEDYTLAVVDFVRAHEVWAAPIVGALAFGESLAFISLLLPAWAMLVAIGAVISHSGIGFWPILTAAAVGAALGDWLSYWIGLKIGPAVAHMWPLSRHPELIPRGERFVKAWGALAIMIGRFFGPLRASVPLVAGIFAMPYWRFQAANFVSAFIWAAMLLTLGDGISKIFKFVWT
jgi:membrane protein DedA with SNARE-associated domain